MWNIDAIWGHYAENRIVWGLRWRISSLWNEKWMSPMFWLSCRTFIYQDCFLGTLSNTRWWTLSYTCLNSPCCNLSSVHRWSLMRAVEMLDSIPADRRQANTETIHRPTHTVCSYTPDYESRLNRWTDFWWEPEKLMETQNGKNGHTHGNRTSCTVMVLSCTSMHQKAYLSVRGTWNFTSKYSPAYQVSH